VVVFLVFVLILFRFICLIISSFLSVFRVVLVVPPAVIRTRTRFMACPSIPWHVRSLTHGIGIRCALTRGRSSPACPTAQSGHKRVIPWYRPKKKNNPETNRNYFPPKKRGGIPNKDDRKKKLGLKQRLYIYVCVFKTQTLSSSIQKHPHPDKWICLFVCSFVRSWGLKKSLFSNSTEFRYTISVCLCVHHAHVYMCVCVCV